MARYTGPRSKVSRRFGVSLFRAPFATDKAMERKNYPPGMHGSKGRRKQSEYAIAMGEKQKLRMQYGVMERQFRRYFEIARRKRGVTGDILLQLLETRLDNVVFRLGLAKTRRLGRQMVTHGHVRVNGRKVSVASAAVRVGDEITIKESPKSRQMAARCAEEMQVVPVPDWLALDKEHLKGTVQRLPGRDDIQSIANDQLVVELYSR